MTFAEIRNDSRKRLRHANRILLIQSNNVVEGTEGSDLGESVMKVYKCSKQANQLGDIFVFEFRSTYLFVGLEATEINQLQKIQMSR